MLMATTDEKDETNSPREKHLQQLLKVLCEVAGQDERMIVIRSLESSIVPLRDAEHILEYLRVLKYEARDPKQSVFHLCECPDVTIVSQLS
jgi:hypothetical protein